MIIVVLSHSLSPVGQVCSKKNIKKCAIFTILYLVYFSTPLPLQYIGREKKVFASYCCQLEALITLPKSVSFDCKPRVIFCSSTLVDGQNRKAAEPGLAEGETLFTY